VTDTSAPRSTGTVGSNVAHRSPALRRCEVSLFESYREVHEANKAGVFPIWAGRRRTPEAIGLQMPLRGPDALW
jgi:hypothetical protein